MKFASRLVALLLSVTIASSRPGTHSRNAGRIVNGSEASVEEFPYITSVQQGTEHLCSGFIYSDLHIVTSASCVNGKQPSQLHIVVGISSIIDYSSFAQTVEVSNVIVHEAYDPATKVNDIAVLKLAGVLIFTKGVQVGYYDEASLSTRTAVTMGWGATMDGGLVALSLRQTTLNLKDPIDCFVYGANQYDPNFMICAGSETSTPCNYDEGSPLVQNGIVIGIMSHNKGCLPPYAPTLYTRMSAHYDWLLKVAGLQPPRPSTTSSASTSVSVTEETTTAEATTAETTTSSQPADITTPATTTTTSTTTTPPPFTVPTAPCINCIPLKFGSPATTS